MLKRLTFVSLCKPGCSLASRKNDFARLVGLDFIRQIDGGRSVHYVAPD